MTNSSPYTPEGYGPGHPWYYVLGGAVLSPKTIKEAALARGYRGYMPDELDRLDALAEPKRSTELRKLHAQSLETLRGDLSAYRMYARQLRAFRRENPDWNEPVCGGVHSAISFKHNHLYNDLAILSELEQMLSKQPDLFSF